MANRFVCSVVCHTTDHGRKKEKKEKEKEYKKLLELLDGTSCVHIHLPKDDVL